MTHEEDTMNREGNTRRSVEDEITNLKDEIAHLLDARNEVTHKLEQAVRERDRLACHVASLAQEEGAA
jgi:prefoldin subunit 5